MVYLVYFFLPLNPRENLGIFVFKSLFRAQLGTIKEERYFHSELCAQQRDDDRVSRIFFVAFGEKNMNT